MSEHHSGCLTCGEELVYLPASEPMHCEVCAAVQESRARCRRGHFVCDVCHGADAKTVIHRLCLASEERDPVALALTCMRHPKVKLHGPEHHFLVPAVLLTAWCNVRGEHSRLEDLLAEARRRSDPVAGGFCGYQGACGSGVGAGIFMSLATGATPLTTQSWRLSNRATARALDVIANVGGPRCCKRDSWLSLLAAVKLAREELGVALPARGPACEFAERNVQCLQARCPFYRGPRDAPAARA